MDFFFNIHSVLSNHVNVKKQETEEIIMLAEGSNLNLNMNKNKNHPHKIP